MRQWSEALGHVLQPRFLFPTSPRCRTPRSMSASPRATRPRQMREGTSISVGYMAENFADLGFPGMLAGIGVIGLLAG